MRAPLSLVAALVLAAAPARLSAQRLMTMPVGAQVRVSSTPYTGTGYAAAASADTFTLIVDRRAAPVRVPVPTITALSVRIENSRRRMAIRRGIMGFAAGTAIWGLSHLWWDYNEMYSYNPGYTPLSSWGAFALFAGTGAALGTSWGYLRPGVRWERATPPVKLYVFQP